MSANNLVQETGQATNSSVRRVKVFCIGFQKAGTTSLHTYFCNLGFRSVHWPHLVDEVCYEALCIPCLHDKEKVVDVLYPLIDQNEAFSDVPFPALYRELHARFRDSRFVLVTRDLKKWWESLVDWWDLDHRNYRSLHPYEYLQYNSYTKKELRYVTMKDSTLLQEIHEQHIENILNYFSGEKDNFLNVDLDDPSIATKLSGFLGVSSSFPFPHLNVGKTYPNIGTVASALASALQHHRAGRLEQAAVMYRRIHEMQPDHPEALHLLGVVMLQVGKNEIAIDLFGKAIALEPNHVKAHNNRGVALAAQGKLNEAVAAYRRAIALKPNYAEAHSNLGVALKAQGKLDEAALLYQRALEIFDNVLGPEHPDATKTLENYAELLRKTRRTAEAAKMEARAKMIRAKQAKENP